MPQIQLGLLHTSTYTSKIIVTNWIRSKHYDKRDDDFNFLIVKLFSCEAPVLSLPCMNKGTGRQEAEHIWYS
jgi:hypothetical protein